MSASTSTAPTTGRVARLFGLEGDAWMRHANPVSVWTRYSVLALIALAIWSRTWIGWWSLLAVALAIGWMMVNPRLFKEPRSTRNWASKSVLGERIWTERRAAGLPPQFTATVPNLANAFAGLGIALLAYGLIVFEALAVLAGILVATGGKSWYLDRMVLLFEDVKNFDPEVASWEY
jgi:hypothetical protein